MVHNFLIWPTPTNTPSRIILTQQGANTMLNLKQKDTIIAIITHNEIIHVTLRKYSISFTDKGFAGESIGANINIIAEKNKAAQSIGISISYIFANLIINMQPKSEQKDSNSHLVSVLAWKPPAYCLSAVKAIKNIKLSIATFNSKPNAKVNVKNKILEININKA